MWWERTQFSNSTFWRLVFSHSWFRIHLQLDFVSLEINYEPLVWEHQSPKCFGGEPTSPYKIISCPTDLHAILQSAPDSPEIRVHIDSLKPYLGHVPTVWDDQGDDFSIIQNDDVSSSDSEGEREVGDMEYDADSDASDNNQDQGEIGIILPAMRPNNLILTDGFSSGDPSNGYPSDGDQGADPGDNILYESPKGRGLRIRKPVQRYSP